MIDTTDIEMTAQIIVRFETKFGVKYVPLDTPDKPVGNLGLSFPEYNQDVSVPFYNEGCIARKAGGELYRLNPGEFVVRFGEYTLIATMEQVRQMWLYTYAMSEALKASMDS